MTISLDRLKKVIQGKEWVKGAVNFDEDLHFSSFYLRSSHARHTKSLYPGYTSIFAFFDGFNESYFLLKSECLETATALVDRALRQPRWLPKILAEITQRSDALAEVFPPQTSPAWLARQTQNKLLALYLRHARRQRSLYQVARLPEALDRGGSYFSTFLQAYLRNWVSLLRNVTTPSLCFHSR